MDRPFESADLIAEVQRYLAVVEAFRARAASSSGASNRRLPSAGVRANGCLRESACLVRARLGAVASLRRQANQGAAHVQTTSAWCRGCDRRVIRRARPGAGRGSGRLSEPTGDAGLGDLGVITVSGDKTSGQVRLPDHRHERWRPLSSATCGSTIDSDSNPLTGDLAYAGTGLLLRPRPRHERSYSFQRWTGSDWVEAPNSTVRISGDSSQITVSVNRSELGNASAFNFRSGLVDHDAGQRSRSSASTTRRTTGCTTTRSMPTARGSIPWTCRRSPSTGPRAGKKLVVTPTGADICPPTGATSPAAPAT